ncbi:retinol dehydrogenase 7-like isoform X1 [Pelobates fuscus]|uniref:retinol dehydrogenase 7-like isoform X1 n=1 Tax=Pelobates fuscus TaxID=191477 RepID=UPI002FE4A40E
MWLPLLLLVLVLILLYRWHRQSQILQNISDKYVLITGCDTGFGNLLAKQLDQHGLRVLAACLTEKGAEGLKKETSTRVQTLILDVSDNQSVSSAAEWITRIVGDSGLWGLVNNAGICIPVAANGWLKKDDFVKVLNVNLLGTIDMTLNLLPLIMKAGGRIVNVSSIFGRVSALGGGYTVSKFGVEAFSDSLRRELCDFGVKVSIIEPGGFKTQICGPSAFESLEQIWENLPADTKKSYGEKYYQTSPRLPPEQLTSAPCVTSWRRHGLQNSVKKMFQVVPETSSSALYKVTDCMEHALIACYPWTRYSAGWDAKLFFIPLSYLPTCVSDYVMGQRKTPPKKVK